MLRQSYNKLLHLLPGPVRWRLFNALFAVRNRPYVYRDHSEYPHRPMVLGSVTLSIDFELAWAWRFSKRRSKDAETLGLHEREQVPTILAALDKYAIPATWAAVGHLFLEQCARNRDGLAHAEMVRVPHFENEWWKFSHGDWFQHDPCTDVRRHPAWYAPDLVESVLSCPTKQELACHSFSHVGFGISCRAEVASAELDACITAMKKYGIRPVSLVFPGNEWGNFDVIASKSIRTVRWFPVEWAEIALPLRRREGLWALHQSAMLQAGWEEDPSILDLHLDRIQRYVTRAAKTKMNAHLWFHPSLPAVQVERVLTPFLRFCAEAREKGLIEILTMEKLGERMDMASAVGGEK